MLSYEQLERLKEELKDGVTLLAGAVESLTQDSPNLRLFWRDALDQARTLIARANNSDRS